MDTEVSTKPQVILSKDQSRFSPWEQPMPLAIMASVLPVLIGVELG